MVVRGLLYLSTAGPVRESAGLSRPSRSSAGCSDPSAPRSSTKHTHELIHSPVMEQ